MSAATITRTTTFSSAGTSGVSFGRILKSEWLKLVTVRSTYWTTSVAIVIAGLLALLIGSNVHPKSGSTVTAATLLTSSTASLTFVALIFGVLGVLSIGGEYVTLQIRSSYTAVPRRWPALVAKALVVAAWSLVVGLIITFGGFGVIALLFGGAGATVSLSAGVIGGLVGGAVYIAIVAAFAVGLGALVRSSAAGIAIVAGIMFVAPIIFGILGGLLKADWATNVGHFLLSAVGGNLYAASGTATLELWAVVIALVAWLAAVWVPALVLTAAKDV